jgi:hypothetical protein
MNNEAHKQQFDAWERGYKEALLDVYLFLTGDPAAMDIERERFDLLAALAEQITAKSSGRLVEVA